MVNFQGSGKHDPNNICISGNITDVYQLDFALYSNKDNTSIIDVNTSHLISFDSHCMTEESFRNDMYSGSSEVEGLLRNKGRSQEKRYKVHQQTIDNRIVFLNEKLSFLYVQDNRALNCVDICESMRSRLRMSCYDSIMDFCNPVCEMRWRDIIELILGRNFNYSNILDILGAPGPGQNGSDYKYIVLSLAFQLEPTELTNSGNTNKPIIFKFNYKVRLSGDSVKYALCSLKYPFNSTDMTYKPQKSDFISRGFSDDLATEIVACLPN